MHRIFFVKRDRLSSPLNLPAPALGVALTPAVLLMASGCTTSRGEASSPQQQDCASLSSEAFGIEGLVVQAAEPVAQGTDLGGGQSAPLDHCRVEGQIDSYEGLEGKAFGVSFELRLPNAWNGSFVHQFNGGADGRVRPALGPILSGDRSKNVLSLGYAVVSSDAGHDGGAFPEYALAGEARFGLDARARVNYGYGAVAKLSPVAEAMVETYYGRPVAYRYGVGSSNGGRHGMVAAARTPGLFDGLLIGYPGYRLPSAAIQHAHDFQTLAALPGGITGALSEEDMHILSNGILEACDALDGLADGLVNFLDACQEVFEVESLVCTDGGAGACLSAAQVEALKALQAGPRNSSGDLLYSTWIWDTGMASANYRGWKLAGSNPDAANLPRIVLLGAPQLAQTFTTPPTPLEGSVDSLVRYLAEFDFDQDAPKVFATSAGYPESANSFMVPPGAEDPDLASFREAGGKAIVFHGAGDPVFSVVDTTQWYQKLDRNNQGGAGQFVRYYRIPGMPHGGGGAFTDDFDFFTPLVGWVERGEAPEGVFAAVSEGNREGQEALGSITRTLCPYPQVAGYIGGSDPSADSFRCMVREGSLVGVAPDGVN